MPRTEAAGLLGRPHRLTVRMRWTLTYTALFTIAGSVMLVLIYVFMRYVPTYAISATNAGGTSAPLSTPMPADALPSTSSHRVSGGLTSADGAAALVVSDQNDILTTLLVWSVIVLVLLAGASAWVGWIMSGRLLRPLHTINEAALRAATGSFDHRVALSGPRDEITDLSDTFDHMLERLDRSFRAHQRFAANASHELRTPLATTQAMLDVAARREHLDDDSTRALLARLRETNSRSILTVEAILDLADLDHSGLSTEQVSLTRIVAQSVDALRPVAAARAVDCTVDLDEVTVRGDPAMLTQLCENLLQNAVRHNEDGGSLRVTVTRPGGPVGGGALLCVENSGARVRQEDVERLTEPFYRASGRVSAGAERSRGLGLAIVESIADAHGAALRLTARAEGGLVATVTFPEW
ncbi:sensor histidine kinase [Rathayibacter tanaceti]|uniref:histidine kinase n=2 Tax=Rathayibacter tanaceti TaxID=1671680 RepID=A0A166I0Z9_9MICO|nr:HAMP domain-containing sensor histidine kinase [Rathayibacter tanaceti]KZX21463.1 Signal transduction histidine-protein kinase ArlS [Rathayibacter tanaceti]QHC54362.1 HAMP domain-containing protein [Rathayibacter tanaceti]TCO38045.1 two-component system sensor histidine kinase VanS [Rathayibacter tanaceti]